MQTNKSVHRDEFCAWECGNADIVSAAMHSALDGLLDLSFPKRKSTHLPKPLLSGQAITNRHSSYHSSRDALPTLHGLFLPVSKDKSEPYIPHRGEERTSQIPKSSLLVRSIVGAQTDRTKPLVIYTRTVIALSSVATLRGGTPFYARVLPYHKSSRLSKSNQT